MTAETTTPDTIDRVGPTLRPANRVVMRQHWSHLLFLHWIIPSEQICPLLPPGLELDTFEGNAYVGLVPFTMTGVRPIWAPAIHALSDFHETNVRTYVHRKGKNPGVWFFSLDAANPIAVWLARFLWKLPYHYAEMRMDNGLLPAPDRYQPLRLRPKRLRTGGLPNSVWQSDSYRWGTDFGLQSEEPSIGYTSERQWPGPTPAACSVRYTPCAQITPAAVGTLEHFLAERYILYAYRDGCLYSGQVNHIAYPLQKAKVHALEENLIAAAGITRPAVPPIAHYAREVDVRIFPLKAVVS